MSRIPDRRRRYWNQPQMGWWEKAYIFEVIRGLKIIKGNSGLFVAMPSRKRPDGQHQDLAHPINDQTRKYLTEIVMKEYRREQENPSPRMSDVSEDGHSD